MRKIKRPITIKPNIATVAILCTVIIYCNQKAITIWGHYSEHKINRQGENNRVTGFRENEHFGLLSERIEKMQILKNSLSLYGNSLAFLFNHQSGYSQCDKEKADKVSENLRVETGHSRDNEQKKQGGFEPPLKKAQKSRAKA